MRKQKASYTTNIPVSEVVRIYSARRAITHAMDIIAGGALAPLEEYVPEYHEKKKIEKTLREVLESLHVVDVELWNAYAGSVNWEGEEAILNGVVGEAIPGIVIKKGKAR